MQVASETIAAQQRRYLWFFLFKSHCFLFPRLCYLRSITKMTEENSKRKRKRSRFEEILKSPESKEDYQRLLDRLKSYTDEDRINNSKSSLRRHIGYASDGKGCQSRNSVLFFIELSPHSSQRGAACQLITCNDRIEEGSYRFAVYPGMRNAHKNAGRTTPEPVLKFVLQTND